MAASIFFTPVNAHVKNVLNGRAAAYSATNRSSDQLNWLLKKTATATAHAYNTKTGGAAGLALSRKGGLENGGLYQLSKGPGATSNDVPHYRPDPHLNSVKISSAGDFGSIRKVEISFTVYSLPQLNTKQPFFDIGAELRVRYQWNNAGSLGSSGQFTGQIYNFSYTLNDSGGFDCTTFAMGVGLNVLGFSARASAPTLPIPKKAPAGINPITGLADTSWDATAIPEDAGVPAPSVYTTQLKLGLVKPITAYVKATLMFTNSLSGLITQVTVAALESAKATAAGVQPNGICIVQYDPQVIGPNLTGEVPLDDAGQPNTKFRSDSYQDQHAYISLGMLTSLINQIIQDTAGTTPSIICSADTPKSTIPAHTPPSPGMDFASIVLISADPGEIIFPGYATYSYGLSTAVESATAKQDFNLDAWTNGANVGIDNYATQFIDGELRAILINVDFINRIFEGLGSETIKGQSSADETFGAVYKKIFQSIFRNSGNRFQLSLVSDPGNANRILMVDATHVNATPKTFEIKAVTDGGFCRSISLASKVPQEMASVAMVAATSTATSINPKAIKVIVGESSNPAAPVSDIPAVLKAIADGDGFTQKNIEALRNAMQQVKVNKPSNDAIVYPIEFSATMDGVEGFVFGNTVKCNYLPAVMQKAKIVHTVLNVEHDISNSDWTTSITTVCRLLE